MRASIHRPTRIEVNLSAIAANFQQVMSHLPAQTQAFAVVKANAYGHGVAAVAEMLAPLVQGFCVSNIDEALELREIGIQKPILVLGVVPTSVVPLAIRENILLTVTSLAWIEQLQGQGELNGLKLHIKIDTGMGRLGFRSSREANQAIANLQARGAQVQGIFTHFATADQEDAAQFQRQLGGFKQLLSELVELPPLIHASNSATSIWHAETVFNMVRLGDILYGLNPSGRALELPYSIRPALGLTTEMVHVKYLEAGSTIGYGASYTCSQSEYIATLPIGYADGLIRAMQGFQVLVDGQPCQIVGRVSMDQVTIRLPKAYPLGTKVTLIGQNVTVQDWADYLGTINYEIVCLLSDRIARYYIKD